jgi:hypothetical protein
VTSLVLSIVSARPREHGVIAAALVRVRAHHPAGVTGAAQGHGKMQIVQEVATQPGPFDVGRAPLRVRIGRAREDRRGIRHLLDEECAAGLRRVLTGHVE